MLLTRLPRFTRRPLFATTVLMMGLLLTAVVSIVMLRAAQHEADESIRLGASQITLKIEERLQSYALTLRSVAGLFQVSDEVSREQWRRFTEQLRADGSLTNVQGIGFSLRIAPEDLQAHEAAVRSEGFADYLVTPIGSRDTYTSIVYLEPFDQRNRQAFGFDMYSEAVRRAAMSQARDTGLAALSGRVELLQETGEDVQAGTLMYLPVYRAGTLTETIAQRDDALIGWAYSPYRMTDLMQGILDDWQPSELQSMGMRIYDGEIAEATLLFSNMPDTSRAIVDTRHIDFNGTRWVLQFGRLPGTHEPDYSATLLTLVGGTLVSILLTLLIFSLARTRNNALRLADQLTTEVRKREAQLKASELRWRFALDGPGDGVWDWDLSTNQVFYSQGWRNLLGLQETPVTDSLQEWESRIHPDDVHSAKTVLQAYLDGRTLVYNNEFRLRCQDGSYKWILDRGAIVSRDADNKPLRMIGSNSDITARKNMELALRQANTDAQHFREALDYVDSYIYIKDAQRRYVYANRATLQLFGRDENTLPGSVDEAFFPEASCQHIARVDKIVLAGEKTREEIEVLGEDGSRTVYLEVKSPIYDENDHSKIIGILGISADITPLKEHEASMERIAHFDALTGLPNRLLLIDRLHQAIAGARRQGNLLAVVYIDLDGFKSINDTQGHDAGDQVLRTFANRLTASVREGDTAARLGGDEFVVTLAGFNEIQEIKPVLQRLLSAANEPFDVNGIACRISASLGVSVFPQAHDTTEDQLLRQADQAMYKAKNTGKDCVYLFCEDGDIQQLELDGIAPVRAGGPA